MAGTPDRSKQQESSGGPIPEERDPRLAMARQSPERVDQATAVFSVRDVPAATESGSGSGSAENSPAGSDSDSDADASGAEDSGPATGSASASDSGADSEPEAGSEDGTEPGAGDEAGDARLRAAVAAWVSGPRDGAADGPEAAGDGAADVAESAAEESEADEPEAADTASDAAEDDGDGDDAVADAAEDSADAEAADAPEGSGDDADAESADAPEATSDDAEPADASEAPEAEAPDADAKSADEAKTPADEAKTPVDVKSSDDAKAPADAKPADDAKADAKPADEAKAPAGEAKAPADAKPAGGDAKPPVDQATAVFKAVKPPVDQPTQMLKSLGSKPAGAGKAESDAERTSKFVPLKGLDSGTPAKPKAQPEAQSKAQPTAPPPAKPYVGPERTTQQPLPPLPPLDLLAELTNTPPPAETPVRTAVRRVKIWTPIVLLLAVVFAVVQAVRPLPAPTLALTAKSTFAFDGDKVSLPWPAEGQGAMDVSGIGSMDGFGEQKPVPIGSVAKAMTAYVVLKDHPLQPGKDGPSIDVDAKAEKEGGYDSEGESTLNTVKEGDKLSQKDALSAIMIPSANNIARLLARWDTGSEEAFVKKMNAAAKDLGMTGTTYTDPSGLKETTVSTAQDQVKLGNELVKIQALMDITKLPTWKDPSGKTWQNYNRLVPYNNAVGVKTGSTTKAGGNLLFAATKDAGGETVTVVGAILGQHRAPIIDTVNAVSKTAMLAAQDAVKASTILKKGDVVGYVDDGLGGQTPVVVTKNVSAVGWAGLTVKLELADGAKGAAIPHSAKAGTQVGELKVGDGSGGAVTVPVALQKDLAEPGFGAKLTRVG
ncbi:MULTISPECIES: D-alanyl-D-alanine carboxypeptidase [unclassified Streptomyces]|uniref:D-alanyl-D-alanine carboxypeptidase n=1 Tax=Streptomyces sp. NBC_00119 TaxID=2975659 RepID=A0AAU1UAP6_9ACTN|nr:MULTISPECIES: D-alanyl-D-alanine carboxypeptidase [unclassified Streptomyces]MCX4644847.1 D-alanyl-D-alanine carboxypeptidase [Streptomyces sp. NBC_01446]MCX5326499.1 D-alanyl-D-alanine carboxypeptidase [Streptomyces sp. NBC_00120]